MTGVRSVDDHLANAELLVEILPYIQRWRGKVVVVKYGGNAMTDPALAALISCTELGFFNEEIKTD